MWTSKQIQADPLNLIWNFATGHLPDFLNKQDGPVGWVRWSHRGVQFLDKFSIPRKQKSYIFSPSFELRFNAAFDEVVRACADPGRDYIQRRGGQSWITEDLIQGLMALRRMGFAHSFETWQEGRLVGGIWGVQMGGLITMSSMFNRVSNASKSAMARTMLHLRERGFRLVDMGMVPDHLVHFGAEWVPRWKYESMLPALLHQKLSLSDEYPCPDLPRGIAWRLPILRFIRGVRRRVGWDRADDENGEADVNFARHGGGGVLPASGGPGQAPAPQKQRHPGEKRARRPIEPAGASTIPQCEADASRPPPTDPGTASAPLHRIAPESAPGRLD